MATPTVNTQAIDIDVLSTQHSYNVASTITAGDTEAYIMTITYTDLTSFDGTVELHFVLGDSTTATRDASDGVVVSGNTITYTLDETICLYAGLICFVRHINSTVMHTTLKIHFSNIRAVPGTTATDSLVSYPSWVASVVTAEELRVTAEEDRETAEGLRDTAESDRDTAEGLRDTAEGLRVTAEGLRVTAESGRVTAEDARAVWEEWDGITEWKTGNKVVHSGSSWIAVNDNTGSEPPSANWIMIASIGASGTIDTSTLTNITGALAGDGTNIKAATASDLPYVNTSSGLTATQTQAAIDELDTWIDNVTIEEGSAWA